MTIHFHDNSSIATAQGLGANAGDILQTTSISRLTGDFSTSSNGTLADSGLSASITPSATSSKVIVIAVLDFMGLGDRDRRLTTTLHYGSVSSSTILAKSQGGQYRTGGDNSQSHGQHTYWYLHSPSSTSSLTYRVGLTSGDGSTVRILGGSGNSTKSYMFLQEVKG
tara:strand:+ start:56 stop:556 length:501 start_codon:yes stop_codon:yes gene_type:complete